MKERPIIFSAPMVRAILEGRKTVTRLGVKPQPEGHYWEWVPGYVGEYRHEGDNLWHFAHRIPQNPQWDCERQIRCPYGQPGDRLWVRETWCYAWDDEREGWTDPERYCYRADGVEVINVDDSECSPWKPSIHMPRRASRITLEVTGVRVERLQDISDEQALAEGVDRTNALYKGNSRRLFADLWDSINGFGSCAVNPWVWVVEFKRLTP